MPRRTPTAQSRRSLPRTSSTVSESPRAGVSPSGLTPGSRSSHGSIHHLRLRDTADATAPEGTSVRATTSSADIRARGRYGEVELQTGSGDVWVEEAERDAQVKVASRDVKIYRVGGSLKVQTAAGDVAAGAGGERQATRARRRPAGCQSVASNWTWNGAGQVLQCNIATPMPAPPACRKRSPLADETRAALVAHHDRSGNRRDPPTGLVRSRSPRLVNATLTRRACNQILGRR